MIASAFDEADRRDPQRTRQRVFLVDGNKQQITAIEAQAAAAAIPAGYEQRLAAALGRLDPAGRRSAVRVAATARQELAGHPARVTTATSGDTVGVAVAASRYECVLAAVAPAGRVPAWRPPRVYLQPGEAGCTATAAAARGLVRPPH